MVDTFNVAAARPSETRLSLDGSKLYSAGSDGFLRVYSVKTGALIDSWDVGTTLGGLDISPDGSFLMVVERQPVSGTPQAGNMVVTVYKVDTATGQSTSYPMATSGGSTNFFDVAILSTGKVLLSQDYFGSGGVNLKLLDPTTGQYSVGARVSQSSVFTRSATGDKVLIGQPNDSGGPLSVYQAGTGIVANAGTGNFNWGIQAFNGTLAASYTYPEGIKVYNSALQLQTNVVNTPQLDWRYGRVADLLFDAAGRNLFVLDSSADAIVQLRTSDWTVVRSIPVNASIGGWTGAVGGSFGSRLILDPQGRYFSVATETGLVLVHNPEAPAMAGTAGADTMNGTLFDDVANGNDGDDTIDGGDGDDVLDGGEGNDILTGGKGNDSIYSGPGEYEDTALGGDGNDKFYFGATLDSGDRIDGGAGTDTLFLTGDYSLGLVLGATTLTNVETISIAGPSGAMITTHDATVALGQVLTVDGSAILALDRLWFNGAAETDGTFNLTGGTGADLLIGGAGNDVFVGGAGNDQIIGGGGSDAMAGGTGDDNYQVDHPGDVVIELSGEGTDQILTALAVYSLVGLTNVENLTGGSSAGQTLTGNALANVITGWTGNDVIDGGTGADEMRGLGGNDVYRVDDAGDKVFETVGGGIDEIRTALATYSLANNPNVFNAENLTATSNVNHDFRGSAADNVITGGSGSDLLRLYDGGNDTVLAGAGSDNIFFIGSLTSADIVNGGADVDTLILQGNYAGGLTLTANITEIENISILGGGNTNFGDPGTNLYDYVLTTDDANFAAGVQARINGAALLAGEDFTFDGTAETNASFVVYGGRGKDTLTGGLGNDIFFLAEDRFSSGDVVNGGSGYDGMFLRGNYTIDFNAPGYTGLFTSIENLTLTSATDERYARGGGSEFDYNLTLSDAIVGAGGVLTVSGTILMASETMILDGSQETDGFFRLFGGKAGDTLKGGSQNDLLHGNLGADTLSGGSGADTFRYDSIMESNMGSLDQVLDFTPGTDKIDLSRVDARTDLAGDQAFAWIGSNAFTGTAGQLRAFQQGGSWILEGDTNGDGIGDLVIALTLQGSTPLGSGDFVA